MKFSLRNPFCVLGLVVFWRVLLLVFTVQPIPANDGFYFDGAVVNWFWHGEYCNPSITVCFPISGQQVFSAYPPLYQAVLFGWMLLFGPTLLASMALHVALFAVAGFLALSAVKNFFPAATGYALVPLLFFGFTFDDRPEVLAYCFGMGSLWLVGQSIRDGATWRTTAGIALALLGTLYTSCIVGALYFGAGFLAVAVTWLQGRKLFPFAPFIAAAVLFVLGVWAIARFEPLWWAGFQENARIQPVVNTGLHAPGPGELLKLARTAPVFLVALGLLPFLFARRQEIISRSGPWLPLVAGIFLMGWVMLLADLTLLAANYVGHVLFVQILLAAGLLALAENYFPDRKRSLRAVLLGCGLLISVRAIGMSTWGLACAWKNSYQSTQAVLRTELEPFVKTNTPVMLSSAFLYRATAMGVTTPIYCDWYFDHAHWTNHAQVSALIRYQPAKLVLTQFDFHRAFVPVIAELRQQPGLVEIQVRDFAAVRTPDSIPSLQRVVQNISWAPVIVDLAWKKLEPAR